MSTPLMGLTLPVDHGSAEIWDTILDTVFGLIDGHDHTIGKGSLIPMGALNVNADLSFSATGTSRAITDLRAIDFSPQPAAGMTALAGAFFLSDGTSGLSANELYYRTTAGVNVKVTSGSALNVAGFAGGIGGDYSAAGALVIFDDATDAYWFQQQVGASVRQYARMRSGDLDLFEYKAHPTAGPVPTNRVRLASPAALAASYALTLLAALPATQQIIQVSAAGVMTASNVMAANQDITVSGTGKYKHGTRTISVAPSGLTHSGPGLGTDTVTLGAYQAAGTAGVVITAPVRLPVGARLLGVRAYTNSPADPLNVQIYSVGTTGTVTTLATSANTPIGGNNTATIAGGPLVIAATTMYGISVQRASGTTAYIVYGIDYDYDDA